jgi:hypothetical protein
LPQIKGARQRNKLPVNQHGKNSTPKQNGWWAIKLFSRTKGQYTNSNCHISLREKLTK